MRYSPRSSSATFSQLLCRTRSLRRLPSVSPRAARIPPPAIRARFSITPFFSTSHKGRLGRTLQTRPNPAPKSSSPPWIRSDAAQCGRCLPSPRVPIPQTDLRHARRDRRLRGHVVVPLRWGVQLRAARPDDVSLSVRAPPMPCLPRPALGGSGALMTCRDDAPQGAVNSRGVATPGENLLGSGRQSEGALIRCNLMELAWARDASFGLGSCVASFSCDIHISGRRPYAAHVPLTCHLIAVMLVPSLPIARVRAGVGQTRANLGPMLTTFV